MSTMNQIFTEFREHIDSCNHTTTGLIECMRYYLDKLSKASGGGGGSAVSYTQTLTTGTKTGSIEIDGVSTDMYAPTPEDVSVTAVGSTGTKIATVTIDSTPTDIYVPYKTTSAVSASLGATSATITDTAIATTSIIDIFAQTASGALINVKSCVVTTGQAVLSFDALEEATSFILHVYN